MYATVMKKLWVTLLMWSFSIVAWSQYDLTYSPTIIQDTIPNNIYRSIKSKLELDKSRITTVQGQEAAYIKELYDQRASFVVQQFNEGYFIVDDEITPYLQSVLDEIYNANPSLSRETTVYAFRSEAVNAMSYGEGTIAFTLGLLSRMENEAQIAFVLCHELAHYHARHSDIKALELAQLNYNKEIKKKIKSISKSDYGKYTKYTQLVSTLGLSVTRHSREKEFEADSLALLFYLNTSYDLSTPVRKY
jgi:predicted Zn-dependent protease